MTDSDLNEAVARKLGWTYHKNLEPVCWHPPDNGCYLADLPNYCHSIEAAWEIALQATNGAFRVSRLGDEWICKMRDQIESADTAPRAICLAFLKLP